MYTNILMLEYCIIPPFNPHKYAATHIGTPQFSETHICNIYGSGISNPFLTLSIKKDVTFKESVICQSDATLLKSNKATPYSDKRYVTKQNGTITN